MKERKKKCAKCGGVKLHGEFNSNPDSSDGRQSYCKTCKNALGKRRRQMNVRARIKHHTATRVKDQLGPLTPDNITRDLETYLGYNISTLVKALRTDLQTREPEKTLRIALNDGYHIDHIHPLSKFPVIIDGEVNWDEFKKCWAISNLSAIPADENLSKGAKVSGVA